MLKSEIQQRSDDYKQALESIANGFLLSIKNLDELTTAERHVLNTAVEALGWNVREQES